MMKVLLLTLALIVTVSGRQIKFGACGNGEVKISGRPIKFDDCGNGEVKTVYVDPCEKEPCQFKKGQAVTMTAIAVASADSNGGTLKVTVELGGVEVEYPGIESDICKIITCPIKKGQEYKIQYKLTAEDYFPDLTTRMKWDVQGDNGRLLCASSIVGIEPTLC